MIRRNNVIVKKISKLLLLFGMSTVVLLLYKTNHSGYHRWHTLQKRSTKTFTRVRPPVNCVRLFEGDDAEQRRAEEYQKDHPKKAISNEEYIKMSRDCDKFIETRGYITSPLSEEEENFPLAFDLLVYKDIEQFERLLRTVYRPQNFYCVHVDKKTESALHEAVDKIAGCFDNVFVLLNNIEVTWGTYSVLEANILCLEALLRYKRWKYFIQFTSQEFPLKTNWELVQIIQALNGSNLIGGTVKFRNPERLAGRPHPPIKVTPVKGFVHIVARRDFVKYAIKNENGQRLLNWSKLVGVPDEIFFSTLNHNPQLGIPGTYLGEPEVNRKRYPEINRYKIWMQSNMSCHGKFVRSVCIFGVRDLPVLAATPHLIVNKFHLDYQPLALDCLEELIFNRTQKEMLGNRYFDTSYYRNLDVAKNHL